MILTRDNYYSPEADQKYMSCSQFESFLRCEAAALARISGTYTPKPSKAYLIGNYFHTFFEGPQAHDEFVNEHAEEIFLKRGGMRAEFRQADEMVAAALSDPTIRKIIENPGDKEKILTGELFGVPWRVRLDKYITDPARTIVDWKTTRTIRGSEESFIEAYNYPFRAAVYMEIEKQHSGEEKDAAFWLVCISKEDPPDKALVSMNDAERQAYELGIVEQHLPRIVGIKNGEITPRRCGKCAYCRATNKITRPVPFWEIGLEEAGD